MLRQRSHPMIRAAMVALLAPAVLSSTGFTNNRAERLLSAHNSERAAHGLAPLTWSEDLSGQARQWGERLRQTGELVHDDQSHTPEPQGENLWAGTRDAFSPEAMVSAWIREKEHYRPGLFPAVSATGRVEDVGHYTQVVWRKTGSVGCAVTENAEEEFLVCRYSTAGNVEGERPF